MQHYHEMQHGMSTKSVFGIWHVFTSKCNVWGFPAPCFMISPAMLSVTHHMANGSCLGNRNASAQLCGSCLQNVLT